MQEHKILQLYRNFFKISSSNKFKKNCPDLARALPQNVRTMFKANKHLDDSNEIEQIYQEGMC